MQIEKYESPKVTVISIEPDERLMEGGGSGREEVAGYEAGFSGGEEMGYNESVDKSGFITQ